MASVTAAYNRQGSVFNHLELSTDTIKTRTQSKHGNYISTFNIHRDIVSGSIGMCDVILRSDGSSHLYSYFTTFLNGESNDTFPLLHCHHDVVYMKQYDTVYTYLMCCYNLKTGSWVPLRTASLSSGPAQHHL